jgi:hypothetical protein
VHVEHQHLQPPFMTPLLMLTNLFSHQVGWQASAACSTRPTTASG